MPEGQIWKFEALKKRQHLPVLFLARARESSDKPEKRLS